MTQPISQEPVAQQQQIDVADLLGVSAQTTTTDGITVIPNQAGIDPIPQAPIVQPQVEPVVPAPAPITPEPLKVEIDEKEIKADIQKEADKKGEELKQELKENKDDDFVSTVIDSLLEDNTKFEFEAKKSEKKAEYLEKENDDLRKQLRDIQYDDSKMVVDDEIKPILRLREQFNESKDEESKLRLVSGIFSYLSQITGKDYRAEINSFYSKNLEVVANMSKPTGHATISNQPSASQYKPTGIVKIAGSGGRF